METSCPLGHGLILGLMRRRGSDFRVSNFEFRVSDFYFRISVLWVSNCEFRPSLFPTPDSLLPVLPGEAAGWVQVSDFRQAHELGNRDKLDIFLLELR